MSDPKSVAVNTVARRLHADVGHVCSSECRIERESRKLAERAVEAVLDALREKEAV